jgi:hypothetical protein
MNGRGGFQGVFRALYAEVGLVYGAPGVETIGHRGRLSGAALCTGFRARSLAGMAGCCGRNGHSFRTFAREMVGGMVV